jgi:hypothetical protein
VSGLVAWRRDIVVALAAVAGMVLLGAPVGLLWSVVAPHVHALVTSDGITLTDPEPKGFIAADGVFLFLTLAVGVVVAAVVGWLDDAPGPLTVVALALGGCLAAIIAWHVGHRVGLESFTKFLEHGRPGEQMDAVVRLRAKTVVLGWGLGAAIGYGAAVALRPVPKPAPLAGLYGSSVG